MNGKIFHDPISNTDVLLNLVNILTMSELLRPSTSEENPNQINFIEHSLNIRENDILTIMQPYLQQQNTEETHKNILNLAFQLMIRKNEYKDNNLFVDLFIDYLVQQRIDIGVNLFKKNIIQEFYEENIRKGNKSAFGPEGLTPKTLEFVYFLLDEYDLVEEKWELLQIWDDVCASKSENDNIGLKTHLLVNFMLEMEGKTDKDYYHKAIKYALKEELGGAKKINEDNPGIYTAFTKAFLKDGNSKYAAQYFRNKFNSTILQDGENAQQLEIEFDNLIKEYENNKNIKDKALFISEMKEKRKEKRNVDIITKYKDIYVNLLKQENYGSIRELIRYLDLNFEEQELWNDVMKSELENSTYLCNINTIYIYIYI